jgi:hypothetical protein
MPTLKLFEFLLNSSEIGGEIETIQFSFEKSEPFRLQFYKSLQKIINMIPSSLAQELKFIGGLKQFSDK